VKIWNNYDLLLKDVSTKLWSRTSDVCWMFLEQQISIL